MQGPRMMNRAFELSLLPRVPSCVTITSQNTNSVRNAGNLPMLTPMNNYQINQEVQNQED